MNLKNVFTKTILFVFVFQIVMFSPTVFAQMDIVTHIESAATEDVKERPPLGEPEIITPIRRSGGGGTVVKKEEEKEQGIPLYYIGLMRRVRDLKEVSEKEFDVVKKELLTDLATFLDQEKKKMETLKINKDKQGEYFKLLDTQLAYVKESTYYRLQKEIKEDLRKPVEVDVLKNPSQFKFFDDDVKVKSLDLGLKEIEIKRKTAVNLLFDLFNPFEVQNAIAVAPAYLPIIEEVNEDAEAVVSYEIKELARDLNNNPVEIVNYIQNNITYEPYFGAKKGSSGCLREKVCNDVDTTSLTVALMRAAGIPARYKKGIAVMTVEQLQDLLGVDETKTVYYALGVNKVPVFTVSGNTLNPNINLADFSGETHLGVEWIYPEIFYNYDEQGANIANLESLDGIENTTDLQAIYEGKIKKHWIPVDAITREYDRTQNEIVHDTASFDTEAFWYDFLQYQGDLSPIEKYAQDLQTQTGKDINQEQYQSTRDLHERQFDILPPTLPYQFASGVDEGGTAIDIETWSQLPDVRRFKVNVSVLRQSDNSEVISTDFYGSEINNVPMDLMYEGATEADEAIIVSYGGIHMTPASLVNIKPYFVTDYGRYEASGDVGIGEPLILQFEYYVNGASIYSDQKFSVAGNSEGIYMVLSKVVDDDRLNDGVDDESEILIGGNARIAWKYIREVEENAALLEKTLDYEYNNHVLRTVITQNRILAEVGGVPTTFDFKGLTMDASAYINDYSRRGDFHTHEGDYRLLWGEQASYNEAQVIEDLTGVNSISTVQGLQYAYANPQDYTIHIIDTGNESVIDTLSLSSNTKQNMHDDVQDGNTIITPDQPVTQENFTGVLYISLDPEKTGTYAIGEQNGSWMLEDFDFDTYCYDNGDGTSTCQGTYSAIKNASIYLHEDNAYTTLDCTIEEPAFNATLAEPGWDPSYGYPCHVPEVPAGQNYPIEYDNTKLSYKVATNATKFFKVNDYSYWITNQEIHNKIDQYIIDNKAVTGPEGTDEHLLHLHDDFETYGLRFSTILGTYMEGTCENVYLGGCPYVEKSAIYYSPNSLGGDIFRSKTDIFNKLQANDHSVVKQLGYPIDHEKYAATTVNGLEGRYQQFLHGQVYVVTTPYDIDHAQVDGEGTYYIIGNHLDLTMSSIAAVYNNEQNGSRGPLGFPKGDSYYLDGRRVQEFNAGRIEYSIHLGRHILSPVWYDSDSYNHFLVIKLDKNLDERVCFKNYVDLDGVQFGETDTAGNIIEQYYNTGSGRDLNVILSDTNMISVNNRRMNGYEPIAVINGDYFGINGPTGMNFIKGVDYSGTRDHWTAMAISQDNDVEFGNTVMVNEGIDLDGLRARYTLGNSSTVWDVLGGSPKIITNGIFSPANSCSDAIGLESCMHFHDQRTAVGVTADDEYMVVLVTLHGGWERLYDLLNRYSANYGLIEEANLFDNGGSPAMMFEEDIKRKDNPLMSLLMVYRGEACN
jgi:Transglutaminase-like superfamily/Phosphodiester glycosidase